MPPSFYYTQHGPVIRQDGDHWVTISLMQDPVDALTQSYIRTKAHDYASYIESMKLHTNSSNNTLFADSKPSIPVSFTSATWGSLASFGARGSAHRNQAIADVARSPSSPRNGAPSAMKFRCALRPA